MSVEPFPPPTRFIAAIPWLCLVGIVTVLNLPMEQMRLWAGAQGLDELRSLLTLMAELSPLAIIVGLVATVIAAEAMIFFTLCELIESHWAFTAPLVSELLGRLSVCLLGIFAFVPVSYHWEPFFG